MSENLLIDGINIKDYFQDVFKRFMYMSASVANKVDVAHEAVKYCKKKIEEGDTRQRWDLYSYEYNELKNMAQLGVKHIGGVKHKSENGKVINDFNSIVSLIGIPEIQPIDPIEIRTPLSFTKPLCKKCLAKDNVDFKPEVLFDPEVYYEEEHLRYYDIMKAFIQDCYNIAGGGNWYIEKVKSFAIKNKDLLSENEFNFFRSFCSFGTSATNFMFVARECFAQNIITQHMHFNIKKPKEIFLNAYMTTPPEPFPNGVYIINKENLCEDCLKNIRNDVIDPLSLTVDDIF